MLPKKENETVRTLHAVPRVEDLLDHVVFTAVVNSHFTVVLLNEATHFPAFTVNAPNGTQLYGSWTINVKSNLLNWPSPRLTNTLAAGAYP